MENKMNKFGLKRLLAVLAVAFACVCMWGCSDDVSFEWERTRRNAKVIGFVDDSLVMVGDYRFWLEVTESWNGEHLEESGAGNPRLCVYNYRVQEEGPRWCDSVAERNNSGWFGGQLTDSIIWGGDFTAKMRMWKIGERPHEIALARRVEDGCSGKFKITSIKQWLNGTFIARGDKSLNVEGDGCQYAVLDTMTRTLMFKRLDERLKWIKDCDDVRAWGDDVYCIILDDEEGNSFVLKNEKDTIPTPRKFAIGGFWGDMIKMSGNICSMNSDEIICSDVIWYGNELRFYQNDKCVAEY
ncbi:hypothetical protein SAMN06298224_2104 [Fibrobacter sp. UWB16]|uniref:hypothetical protein n=1 Tax=unclassified Fibrobacter TaxID=2634177 RepID=UPI000B5249E1|nr:MULTISPECIES: hypothetical protein [unclassified Fibrobacter]OWV17825.1 hypothetical protein B7991_11425 [Fibrobacter sp. UWB3]SOD15597.1 hypothetical protein SAMN06298224_2104 [Fibrobacter sp. UWB16]